jgi:hypothetical protein
MRTDSLRRPKLLVGSLALVLMVTAVGCGLESVPEDQSRPR